MNGALSVVDVGILWAAGAVVVFAVAYAMLRGKRGDPLERMAGWASARGLEYQAPHSDTILATFRGELDGHGVEVEVIRVPRGFGNDLPARLTTVIVGTSGRTRMGQSAGDPVCTLQPAAWVLDRNGDRVGEPVSSGNDEFDGVWSARGADAEAVARILPPSLCQRLLSADAEGLIIEIKTDSVSIPMPGICADARELDRRLAIARALALVLFDH